MSGSRAPSVDGDRTLERCREVTESIWRCQLANVGAAQQALFHRADCNRAARRGEYDADADAPRAA